MNNKYIFILTLLVGLLSFVSCKSNKELAYKYQPPTKEEEIIENHLISNNIEALIEDCVIYPDYNCQVANYLLNDIDYSLTNYSQLLHYQQLAQHDSILYAGYEFLVHQKEEQILSAVSEMTLNEIANYYKTNISEQSFLRPVLCNAFIGIIDTLQYTEIRTLYQTFSATDIGDSIAPFYFEIREAIRPQITKSYENYCENEEEVRDYYIEKTKDELDLYIANSMELFIDDIFSKDLPRDNAKVKDAFDVSFNKYFSKTQISSIVNSNIEELVSIINSGRYSFLEELSDETVDISSYYIPVG